MASTTVTMRLEGQDNLTPTLNKVKNELNQTAETSQRLDEIRKKFEKISNGTAPLKRQLRELQTLMSNMNLDGLNNTDLFTEMAERAGQLSDAMGDARTAISAFANDTMKLQAAAQAFQLVAGGASVVTGAMGLLGVQSDKVQQAMLKVQSAIALVNGVQAIANLLNKDSVLMLRIKQIQLAANTAATTANTAAEGANTVATGANTVARKAWNVTVAIGKALMGDFTGLVLVGAAALLTYALCTDNNTKSIEKENEATKRAKEEKERYTNSVASSTAQLVSKYNTLKDSYTKMRTEGEKTQWIKENQTELHNLGIKINNVIDADNVFINNTDNVVKAFELRAKAAALASLQTEAYEDYYKKMLNAETNFKGGKSVTFDGNGEVQKLWSKFLNSKKSSEWSKLVKDGKLTDTGAKEFSDYLRQNGKKIVTRESLTALDELNKTLEGTKTQLEDVQKEYDSLNLQGAVTLDGKVTDNTDKGGNKNPKKDDKKDKQYINESLKWYDEEIRKREDELKSNKYSDEEIQNRRKELDLIKQQRKELAVKLGFEKEEKKIQEGSIEYYQNLINQNNKLLKESGTLSEEEISNLNKQNKEYEGIIKKLEIARGLKKEEVKSTIGNTKLSEGQQQGGTEDKRTSYHNAQNLVQQIQQDVKLKITGLDEGKRQIDEINEKLKALGLEPIVIHVKADTGELQTEAERIQAWKDQWSKLGDTVSTIGGAFQSLGQTMSNLAGEDEALAKGALIASAVGQLALTFAGAMKGTFTPWDWIAGAVAGVATLTSVVAQLQSFSGGGIVQGTNLHNDGTLVRVNGQEMILNDRQQNHLFKAIDENRLGNNGGLGGKVEFVIDGRNLKGVLNNYNSKMSKVR